MSSICFDCKNATASRCSKIRTGLPIEGWKAKNTEWGYAVKACPNYCFDYDGYQRIKCLDLCAKIKVSGSTFRRMDFKQIKSLARSKGYSVIRVPSSNEKTYKYYIKEGL